MSKSGEIYPKDTRLEDMLDEDFQHLGNMLDPHFRPVAQAFRMTKRETTEIKNHAMTDGERLLEYIVKKYKNLTLGMFITQLKMSRQCTAGNMTCITNVLMVSWTQEGDLEESVYTENTFTYTAKMPARLASNEHKKLTSQRTCPLPSSSCQIQHKCRSAPNVHCCSRLASAKKRKFVNARLCSLKEIVCLQKLVIKLMRKTQQHISKMCVIRERLTVVEESFAKSETTFTGQQNCAPEPVVLKVNISQEFDEKGSDVDAELQPAQKPDEHTPLENKIEMNQLIIKADLETYKEAVNSCKWQACSAFQRAVSMVDSSWPMAVKKQTSLEWPYLMTAQHKIPVPEYVRQAMLENSYRNVLRQKSLSEHILRTIFLHNANNFVDL